MAITEQRRVSIDDRDDRTDETHHAIEQWLRELGAASETARTSEAFTEWLEVQSRFHDYSVRNTLLIARQCPEATHVAGYKAWQTEFGRQVREGERAIWIWAPIVARQCPTCGNSKPYHERHGCEYDETPPETWSRGPVGFKPVPVFDVSQTEGEPLPELETMATGEADELVELIEDAGEALGVTVDSIPESEWPYGAALGTCRFTDEGHARVAVIADLDEAARALVLVHEYAHALLHVDDGDERGKREVEAEAVAYVVGRRFQLDVDGSALYLAAWSDEVTSTIEARLARIAETARAIIDAVADELDR